MFRDCDFCGGLGLIWVNAHSREIDVRIEDCPHCEGAGEVEIDDDEGEGDDDAD